MIVRRVHIESASRDSASDTDKYIVKLPQKLRNVKGARLISAEFDARETESFLSLETDLSGTANVLRFSFCILTEALPKYDEANNVKTVDVTFDPITYTFDEFKTKLETTLATGLVGLATQVGSKLIPSVTLNTDNHLEITFIPSGFTGFLGLRVKAHTGPNFYAAEAEFNASVAYTLGFEYDQNDGTLEYSLNGDTLLYTADNTPEGSFEYYDITTGVNDTLKFGVSITKPGQVIGVNNLFLMNIVIPAGRYDTSELLKFIEDYMNSPRIYVDANANGIFETGEYVGGGLDATNIGGVANYGKMTFRVRYDEDLGRIKIDYLDDIALNNVEKVWTKVYAGVDIFPTQTDYDNSLCKALGIAYKPLEDASTIYDSATYQMNYDILGRYGDHVFDDPPQITVTNFTPRMAASDTVTVVDGKNTMKMGIATMYNGNERVLSINNVWTSTVKIKPGTYTMAELISQVELYMNTNRRYSADVPSTPDFISGGYNYNFLDMVFNRDLGRFQVTLTRKTDTNSLEVLIEDETQFSLVNSTVTNFYVRFFNGIDEFPTQADFDGSLPDLLGFKYEPSLVTSDPVSIYDKTKYTIKDPFFKKLLFTDTEALALEPRTTPLEISVGLGDSTNSDVNILTVRRDVPIQKYTFGEVRTIVEKMFSDPVIYKNTLLAVDPDGGLNKINGNARNTFNAQLKFNETDQKIELRLDPILVAGSFGGEESHPRRTLNVSINRGLDLFGSTAAYETSIPFALGFNSTTSIEYSRYDYNAISETLAAPAKELFDLSTLGSVVYLSIKELDDDKITGTNENRENSNRCFAKLRDEIAYEPRNPEKTDLDLDYLDQMTIELFQLNRGNIHEKISARMKNREHAMTLEFYQSEDKDVICKDVGNIFRGYN